MSKTGRTRNSRLETQNARAAQPHPCFADIKGAALAQLEVEPQLQLERTLRRHPVSSRRSLEGHVSERVRIVEVQLCAAIVRRCAESGRWRTWRWMIEDVSRIHPDSAPESFIELETLGQGHIRAPDSRRFDRIQTDVATGTRQWVLQDDVSRFVSDSLKSAETLQARINPVALGVSDFIEDVAKVAAGIRAGCPLDATSCVEIERSDLVRSSTTIEVVLRTDR